jgi:L-ascorbate metabolism protein UlaG (beta-lactamase superfamily)
MADYKWLGHAAFMLEGAGVTVYIDPYELQGQLPKADIILVTHSHHDHLSLDDIREIAKAETVLVAPPDCTGWKGKTISLKAGQSTQLGEVKIEAVPAYNVGKQFHPKERGWVGYIITLEGKRFYHAGDTDLIPEMSQIHADVAFLPVGGKYTMDATEAAKAANTIKPELAVPMHWGTIVGSQSDAEAFCEACKMSSEVPAVGGR